MEIGKLAGIPQVILQAWYSKVVLGEMHIGEMFLAVEGLLQDNPALLKTLQDLKKNLPLFK